jgi:hypothetical protein
MSFLDNLESSLKNLENRDERDGSRERERRQLDKQSAMAAAPYAEVIKTGPFTKGLLDHAVRIGHVSRTKVNLSWVGSTLRLEARNLKLELRPAPEGVQAVFFTDGVETNAEPLDMDGNPERLASRWLAGLSA